MRKVEKKMGLISDKVNDTALLAEAEAFQTARLYYNSVKASARAGDEIAEDIARDMGVHYKRKRSSKEEPKEEPTPTPATPPQEEAEK